MSDPRLARTLAGARFRRADTQRDERAAERKRPVEDFLLDLAGWLPMPRESARSIEGLRRSVETAATGLRELPDGDLAARFRHSVGRMHAGRAARRGDRSLSDVLACLAVACERRLGMRPHPVQLAGVRALLRGELAEMQTGEGKTLVAALAATAMAGSGAAVHVISTNDYLARRDSEEMSALFDCFGIRAGCIQGGMSEPHRRAAYAHPICYASGKEVVFDYLKDRLAGHGVLPARVSRLHGFVAARPAHLPGPLIPAMHFAIVDEADSVMIDEARTPMILSRQGASSFDPALLRWAIDSARRMQPGRDFRVGAGRDVDLLPGALSKALTLPPGTPPSWQAPAWREQLLRQALAALHLFHRDQQYVVVDDKVQIVDEPTGRLMPDRSWEQGLHQLIETKEQLPLTPVNETLARMTFQRFFRRYYLVCGLTGTAAEAARELWSVYGLRVRRMPPNRPKVLTRRPDRCHATTASKWAAVADSAAAAAARGQAVLVGTRSVGASEQVSAELARRNVAHVVLNARQDAQEARIVADAGLSGRITVATNMAGRGTDIKPDAGTLAAGGLHVILTEFHDSPRVDRQLFGRCARQGDPGSAQAIVSAQDALFEHQPGWWRHCAIGEGRLRRLLLRWLVRRAQSAAERRAYLARLQTLRHDRELHRLIGFAGRVT
jgi:preprotein translocase subunit SecA